MHTMASQLADCFPEYAGRYTRCGRKLAYTTVDQALAVALHRQQASGVELHVYLCEFSQHYHLSSLAPTPAQFMYTMASYTDEKAQKAQLRLLQQLHRTVVDLERRRDARRLRLQRISQPIMGAPFESRVRAWYAAQHRELEAYAELFDQWRLAHRDFILLCQLIQIGSEATAISTTLALRIAETSRAVDDDSEAFAQEFAAYLIEQHATLAAREEVDVARCRVYLAEKYSAMCAVGA